MIGIIGAIALATQTKSFQFADQTRQKLFFLNNQHYICKKLSSSKLSKHIESTHDDFVNNQLSVEEEKRRDEFLELWLDIKVQRCVLLFPTLTMLHCKFFSEKYRLA
jgi:hypothetical protein